MNTSLNDNQKEVLAGIIKCGKAETKSFHTGTLKALDSRGFVKFTENKKGKFVQATAKGKKALN